MHISFRIDKYLPGIDMADCYRLGHNHVPTVLVQIFEGCKFRGLKVAVLFLRIICHHTLWSICTMIVSILIFVDDTS